MATILVVNPGSTSTKIAVFEDDRMLLAENIKIQEEDLEGARSVLEQKRFRKQQIEDFLEESGTDQHRLDGIIGIGGFLHPSRSGIYEVNDAVYYDLSNFVYGEHVSNLGGIIARDMAEELGIRAFIADPVTTDEISEVARISGMPALPRSGKSHALNQKRIAGMAALALGKSYEETRLIVCHLGGGISIVAHENGRMIDTNSARGEGPFSMDRCGGINTWEVAKLCYSGMYSQKEVMSMISGQGGVVGYLGVRDFREVTARRRDGDEKAALVFEAMAYQIAKEIGAMGAVLKGRVDAIVFTGGMSYASELIKTIEQYVSYIADSLVFPGENEMEALAEYLRKALAGEIEINEYRRCGNGI